MEGLILAHDLGTSGDKATLFTTEGRLVASATAGYDTKYYDNGGAEQEPGEWWRAVVEATARVMAGRDPRSIAVIGFSGQMMGCVCVDKAGRPLRPSLIYCDQRAVEEERLVLERIEARDFYGITGHRVSATYPLPKLMWLKRHEPETYAKTAAMLNAKDYLNFRLTGVLRSEYSDASGTGLLDLEKRAWSERIVELAGLDGGKLPELVASTDVVGELTSDAAALLGLKPGIPVVAGGGDGVCAGTGVGSVRPGVTYAYLGSSAWIATTTDRPIYDETMRSFVFAHAVPGAYHSCGAMQTAGTAYGWARKNIAAVAEGAEGPDEWERMNAGVLRSPPGARGLVFLPYLLGERAPRWNPEAKGAFLGLTLEHDRDDLLRAVMEGITMNLAVILDIFRRRLPIAEVTVIGGGAKGEVWRRIMADIFETRILRPDYLEEATSMGAAIIAGVGAGLFKDFSAAERFTRVTERLEPEEANFPVYRRARALFDECYEALEPLFPRLGPRPGR